MTSHEASRVFWPKPSESRSTAEPAPSWKPWSRNVEPSTRVMLFPSCFSYESEACRSSKDPPPSVTLWCEPRRVKTCTMPAKAETP